MKNILLSFDIKMIPPILLSQKKQQQKLGRCCSHWHGRHVILYFDWWCNNVIGWRQQFIRSCDDHECYYESFAAPAVSNNYMRLVNNKGADPETVGTYYKYDHTMGKFVYGSGSTGLQSGDTADSNYYMGDQTDDNLP